MIREEGLEAWWERHRRIATMMRAGLHAVQLRLVTEPEFASETVTAVHSPFPTANELAGFLADLRTRYSLVLADGLYPLAGSAFRIGHLGAIAEGDVYAMLTMIEAALGDHRLGRFPGHAVRAARRAAVGLEAACPAARARPACATPAPAREATVVLGGGHAASTEASRSAHSTSTLRV